MSNFNSTINYFNNLLNEAKIPYTIIPLYDGAKWTFPRYKDGDIAIHSGTYYSDSGYLESLNLPWDKEDVSICTPIEMVRRLQGEPPCVDNEKTYTYLDAVNSVQTLLKSNII